MSPNPYGILPTGEPVQSHTLANAGGCSLEVIDYGATITSLRVPGRDGRLADVVLGFCSLECYLAPHPYLGAIAGRVAGRIGGARFVLDGCVHALAANDAPNHLHGGRTGLNRRLWSAAPVIREDGADSLRLTYRSADGEEGYPGSVYISVTYTLTADNSVVVESEATADRVTPLSLTQHSYFNLAGEGTGSVADHVLQIHSDDFAPADAQMTLLGKREPVAAAGNDFNAPRRVGDALPHLHKAHGDLYFVRRSAGESGTLVHAASLSHPASGRVLSVSTTEDCLQLYTGVSLDGSCVGKSGRAYGAHAGLCLECEGYPDGVNTPALGDILLRPGRPQRRMTIYAFSTR